MQVFPEYTGAMVNWQRVAEVPGARQALSTLAGKYRLVVATNAADSSSTQVRAALDRVGLGEHIEMVLTRHELMACKPSREFFNALALKLGANHADLIFVGDEFVNDVMGPHSAGWRTIWLNPGRRLAPEAHPIQDAELQNLHQLPDVLECGFLPSVAECLVWLKQYGGSDSLLGHVRKVAAIAYAIAVQIGRCGVNVNPILAHRGGLLHDLAKGIARHDRSGKNHGELAAEILLAHHQSSLSEIARRHILFGILDDAIKPRTWEEKLVYYADKWVEGGSLVGLTERIQALRRRYNLDGDKLEKTWVLLREIEGEIQSAAGMSETEFTVYLQDSVEKR